MDWNKIKKFNFTWGIPDGAWLEDSKGNRSWESFKIIIQKLGELWLQRQIARQGWMTGCWIEVV